MTFGKVSLHCFASGASVNSWTTTLPGVDRAKNATTILSLSVPDAAPIQVGCMVVLLPTQLWLGL